MPLPGSSAEVLFVSLSCSHGKDLGAWPRLERYVKSAKPRFLVMMGDQIYADETGAATPNVWTEHLDSKPAVRRQAFAEKYQEQWSREPARTLLADTPTYMMWDDHEIKNGWGSFAADSPTLAAQYPKGAAVAAEFNAFFEDARDVYWHFEACRNPPPPASLSFPTPGARKGIPFIFRCGRLVVLVLDDRGARDLWREEHPVLGQEQWQFITNFVKSVPADVDALVVVIPLPIAAMSPTGTSQNLLGDRTDDVELFRKGDRKGLLDLGDKGDGSLFTSVAPNINALSTGSGPVFGDIGNTVLSRLTDARDQWANHFCQPEQEMLIRLLVDARLTNRLPSQPRELMFIGGDLHAGGLFELSFDEPQFMAPSLVTSGISKKAGGKGIVGILMDENFDLAEGIHAELKKFTPDYNFGVTQVVFGGGRAIVTNAIAHQGDSSYWNLTLP
jgi:hypothetical protein